MFRKSSKWLLMTSYCYMCILKQPHRIKKLIYTTRGGRGQHSSLNTSIMNLLVFAGWLALLCAVVSTAPLTDREKSTIQALADELHYHKTDKGTAGNTDKQGNLLFDHCVGRNQKLMLLRSECNVVVCPFYLVQHLLQKRL